MSLNGLLCVRVCVHRECVGRQYSIVFWFSWYKRYGQNRCQNKSISSPDSGFAFCSKAKGDGIVHLLNIKQNLSLSIMSLGLRKVVFMSLLEFRTITLPLVESLE